jgi:hypothetical protein
MMERIFIIQLWINNYKFKKEFERLHESREKPLIVHKKNNNYIDHINNSLLVMKNKYSKLVKNILY